MTRLPAAAVLAVGLVLAVAATVAAGSAPADGDTAGATGDRPLQDVVLETVAGGFDRPVLLVGAGDGSGARYVVESRGAIWRLLPDGSTESEPFLDIRDRVLDHNERGLLGLAFHPDFAVNGRLYVTYSRKRDGATQLSEFSIPEPPPEPSPGADSPEPRTIESTERPLLVVPQPSTLHKAGMLAFDLDGRLLMAVGDGSAGNDPERHALDTTSLLGKLLRLDVDAGWPYGLPSDNGFSGVPSAHPEIHAIGLRNPWRFSVDPSTGDVFIGDVGQQRWEEVDVLPRGAVAASFGWSDLEGDGCFQDRACRPGDHIAPAVAYPHRDRGAGNCAVIGGYVYRGDAGTLPDGMYVFTDYCSGTIWGAWASQLRDGDAGVAEVGWVPTDFGSPRSFGQDDAGEIYMVTETGLVLRLVGATAAGD